jgi:hypothetical protein
MEADTIIGMYDVSQKGRAMATYAIHFFCKECLKVHPTGVSIGLNDGPPQIATLMTDWVQCPTTGKLTIQHNNHQVFLVPIGSNRPLRATTGIPATETSAIITPSLSHDLRGLAGAASDDASS